MVVLEWGTSFKSQICKKFTHVTVVILLCSYRMKQADFYCVFVSG